jgi:Na+/melibiose symporter-like transporter
VSSRDRTTLRRALAAGAIACVVVGLPLFAAAVPRGGGRAGLVALLLGLTVGGIVASLWLLLAALLDLLAGHTPSDARLLWTLGVVLAAAASPVLLLAAGG